LGFNLGNIVSSLLGNSDSGTVSIQATPSSSSSPSLNDQLVQQQLDEANFNALLRPFMLDQMGLTEEADASGNKTLRNMTEDEKYAKMTEEQKASYDVEKAATAQQLKYSKGEGETPESIKNALADQRRTAEAVINQRLGAKGAKLSTPGIESAGGIGANELGVKSAYAYGNESQGLGLLGNAATNLYNTQQNFQSAYSGGANLPGLGVAANSPFVAQNDLSNLQNSINEQRKYALAGGLLQAVGSVGSVAGTYLTKGMGGKK
jgi:hypothetical protein